MKINLINCLYNQLVRVNLTYITFTLHKYMCTYHKCIIMHIITWVIEDHSSPPITRTKLINCQMASQSNGTISYGYHCNCWLPYDVIDRYWDYHIHNSIIYTNYQTTILNILYMHSSSSYLYKIYTCGITHNNYVYRTMKAELKFHLWLYPI